MTSRRIEPQGNIYLFVLIQTSTFQRQISSRSVMPGNGFRIVRTRSEPVGARPCSHVPSFSGRLRTHPVEGYASYGISKIDIWIVFCLENSLSYRSWTGISGLLDFQMKRIIWWTGLSSGLVPQIDWTLRWTGPSRANGWRAIIER